MNRTSAVPAPRQAGKPRYIISKDIKAIRDVADIFRQWKKCADKKTYRTNKKAAEKQVITGLDEAKSVFPHIKRLANQCGVCDRDPEYPNSLANNALQFIEERFVNIDKDSIIRHETWLVKEIMGKSDSSFFLLDYLVLAKDIERWLKITDCEIPNDLITLAVAVSKYHVSRTTLKRSIQTKILNTYRPKEAANNSPHKVSESEVAANWPKR